MSMGVSKGITAGCGGSVVSRVYWNTTSVGDSTPSRLRFTLTLEGGSRVDVTRSYYDVFRSEFGI